MFHNEKGFTLIEIMLSLTILAAICGITLQITSGAATSTVDARVQEKVSQDARKMMEMLTSDLRDAGFGVFLNDLGNVSVNEYFTAAFESNWSGSETVSDGINMCSLKMGAEITSDMPASSTELKVDRVDAFLPYQNGYALVYQNGEYQVLHLTRVQDDALHLQHRDDNTKWVIPAGSPVYRVDKIEWIPSGETVTRKVNGEVTHTFDHVRFLSFKYVLRDGSIVDSMTTTQAAQLLCVDVDLDVYRIGGRKQSWRTNQEFHVHLNQRVSPRNL